MEVACSCVPDYTREGSCHRRQGIQTIEHVVESVGAYTLALVIVAVLIGISRHSGSRICARYLYLTGAGTCLHLIMFYDEERESIEFRDKR